MIQLLEEKRDELIALCLKYQVRRLDLFGSAAKGRFAPETSDLDFVAEFLERSNRTMQTVTTILRSHCKICFNVVLTCSLRT